MLTLKLLQHIDDYAAEKLKAVGLNFVVDGEFKFDAAFSDDVAKIKASISPVTGKANAFIFLDINAGNIGYKMRRAWMDFRPTALFCRIRTYL